MSDNHRKLYSKKGTGTVPKIKCGNNTSLFNHDEPSLLSNNLSADFNRPNTVKHLRNSGKYQTHPYFGMDRFINEQHQNGTIMPSNDLTSQNVSGSISRRNSSETVPKCDNITKYPDKKQIEDKLNQIREYLHITSTLMSNMKNSEDQMLENGFDSTADTASHLSKGFLEKKVEHANRQLEMLHEHENLLITLQMKAENQLRDARHAQQRLCAHQNISHVDDISDHNSNEINDVSYNPGSKKANQDIIKELEDRLNSLRADNSTPRQGSVNIQEQFQAQVDSIQQKINQLRDSNDNRNQLVHLLDKRDVQLQSEHMELQGKLRELQNKKMQVDQLVSQLQSMNEESEEDDIGFQVRKIVTMKEQLSKLKDMLEIVKNSENLREHQNVNESDIAQTDVVNPISSKSDNMIQNDVRSSQHDNHENISNSRLESNTRSSNERKIKEKQVNKKSMNANEKERMKLQAELHAKKRELEELMCKHKAASSNLNQDVQCENKSDIGATNHSLYEGTTNSWYPMPSNLYHLPNSSERYSSDEGGEDDINEYSELNSSGEASNLQMIQPMAALNYPTSNYVKHKSAEPSLDIPESYMRTSSHSPDHSVHSVTGSGTRVPGCRNRSNNERDAQNKSQVQKQLELIRSVCDSMLEQQTLTKESSAATQNVRNNLTPSPLYSDLRQYSSSNPLSGNTLNIMHPVIDASWTPSTCSQSNIMFNDASGYQNWLTTNTLQTQAFMLNTLNQCCQMLWLQQRELTSLRNTIAAMQEKLQTSFDQNNPIPVEGSQIRTGLVNSKMNQVSSATSLPNLNHPHATHTITNTIESAYANQNNLHNARILESSLNNSVHQNAASGHSNNTLLQGVNQSLPSQIWNGQALNNQVAPGNRANNYWDNFRSYSRQNLLSSKSNEGLQSQSSATERTTNTTERCSYTLPSFSTQKRNPTQQESLNSSVDNTPKRKTVFKSPGQPLSTESIVSSIPPDVLNINEIQISQHKSNENNDLVELPLQIGFEAFTDAFDHLSTSINASRPETQDCKNCTISTQRNRNEWQNNTDPGNRQSKSKLFEELRENVYKEVASLISANQGRPHFLIQLFRDLQLVSSDPMRRKTLQSIQSLISHSLSDNASSVFQQSANAQTAGIDNDVLAHYPSYFEVPANSWNHLTLNIESDSGLDTDCPDYLSEVLEFLNSHSNDILQPNLLDSLKELLTECTFSTIFLNNNKDSIIQKHFVNSATEAFEQYKGKRVQDVRLSILQTIEDLLRGEISLIRLMRENMPNTNDLNSLLTSETKDSNNTPQIQNGDLAEADQSRLEIEDEEEGAVGGVLNIADDCNTNSIGQTDTEFTEQGLDQVPTRLTAHSRSQLSTPIRDHLNSTRADASEQF
ncbi:hypothetical protein Trydic_g9819 [Trypoxylus dichotomus]